MPVTTAPVTRYTLQDAARILGVPPAQVNAWQRAALVTAGDQFTMRDLRAMQRLRNLRQQRLSVRSIQKSVRAMQQIAGLAEPLHESVPLTSGPRLVFRHGGALLDPLTQQLGFDFEPRDRGELSLLKPEHARGQQSRDHARAQELFQQAVHLEEKAATVHKAATLYAEILQLWPRHAPACINLGTIHYNAHRYMEAEQCYRKAAEIDPDYALAFFDLGNVLDELRRLPEAIDAYRRAIQLMPAYADAHYNLAIAYERTGERRRALRHWMHYVRLDPVGPWATHARTQAKRTMASEKLSIVARGGKLAC